MYSIELTINPADIESSYKHVHHAHALRFLERARLAYLEALGMPNERFISQGLFLVITDIQVRYLRELTGGTVLVTCENPAIDEKNIILEQRIINPKGKDAVKARVTSMFLSKERGRSVAPPDLFRELFVQSPA